MQIRELAERILFGDRWEDKLVALDRYEDSAPGTAFVVPERPGRPVGLGLDEWHGREKMRFRDVGKLHSERERGLVLHFFANHELLALELMALALLKFPDAPQKFRRGVVQTLKDEQEHVRMYGGAWTRSAWSLGRSQSAITSGKRSLRCAARAILSLV